MKYVPRCATEHVRVGPGSVSALLLVLSIASGCVATTPTESSTTTAAPATATKSTATQSIASTTRRKKPTTSTAKAPSTKTPEQQDVVASIAQGVTAALPVETAAEPVPEWLEEESAEEQLPEWLEEEPAEEPVPEWLQAEAQTDMEVSGADAGGIWIDDNCEWAEVNGFTGYVAEDAGQLFIFSEAGEYLADVPPGLFPQCGY